MKITYVDEEGRLVIIAPSPEGNDFFNPKKKKINPNNFSEVKQISKRRIKKREEFLSQQEIKPRKNNRTLVFYAKNQSEANKKNTFKFFKVFFTMAFVSSISFFAIRDYIYPLLHSYINLLISKIELSLRPPTSERNQIPKQINENETIPNSGSQGSKLINLSEQALEAMTKFTSDLNNRFVKYSDIGGSITPSFVVVEFDETNKATGFKLFCDLNQTQGVCLEFNIKDQNLYEEVFKSNTSVITDIINGLNSLTASKNLTDSAIITPKINGSAYTSPVREDTKITEIDGVVQLVEDVYTFNTYSANEGIIYENKISIPQTTAAGLLGFDADNPSSLYDMYLDYTNEFTVERTALPFNNPSLVLLSAKKINQEKNQQLEF